MDALDRKLLNILQDAIPLVRRPFAALGRTLEMGEEEVLSRTQRLKKENIIRQIGPIFSSRRLGYQSTLVAFRVRPERLDWVAARVSAHPGVSHNYSRNHVYNLWFTLTLPPDRDLEREIARLAGAAQVADYLNLPSVRVFKIGVHFDMSHEGDTDADETNKKPDTTRPAIRPTAGGVPLTELERDAVRVLQGDLPLLKRPFRDAAAQLGVREEKLLEVARDLNERGIMRRFSAVLKHRRAGFTANGMGCWVLPEERIEAAGEAAAAFPAVSHCYQRPAHPPRWPYNLFTMVHGQTREEVETVVARICDDIDPLDYAILYSRKEYKKERVRYFVGEQQVGKSASRQKST